MGLLDIFNASKIKEENSRLAKELEIAKSKLTPRMLDAILLEEHINELKATEFNLSDRVRQTASSLSSLEKEIKNKRKMLVDIDDEILYQEFALYKPKYDFANSDQYKERLAKIRDQQKAMIKNEIAIVGNINWTVDGSKAKGAKMVRDIQKLLLRAFNSECDEVVSRVSYANFDSSKSRIEKSYQSISNLGKVMKIEISYSYLQLKIQELTLAFEYKQKKQEEKEEQKILKAQLREEAKLQKEIEETRKKILKEQQHYQNALNSLNKKIENASDLQLTELLNKKAEIEVQLSEIDKNIKDIDYRESNAKAGYVYIISNIGAFGENVYKIGMTRRLDPQERIDELSDASVPFNFDVHAMIFSENAPALENALHKAFESKKLNMVNQRREFFSVSLEEIKKEIRKNHDKTVEFIDIPEAEQYRTSLLLKSDKT